LFVCCMFTFGSFLLNSIPFIILLLSLHIYFWIVSSLISPRVGNVRDL
jgi:hypothetical protein